MSLLSYHLPSFSLVFHMNSRELIFLYLLNVKISICFDTHTKDRRGIIL
jgi:hypothetical protein